MKHVLAALLLSVAAPAAATTVEIASGDWGEIPELQQERPFEISPEAVGRIHDLVRTGTCPLGAERRKLLDLQVPFLVHFNPDGSADRVVLQKLDCPRAESILGAVVLQLLKTGAIKPTGENRTGWYRSEIGFIST